MACHTIPHHIHTCTHTFHPSKSCLKSKIEANAILENSHKSVSNFWRDRRWVDVKEKILADPSGRVLDACWEAGTILWDKIGRRRESLNPEYKFTEETRPAHQELKYCERKFINSTARMKRKVQNSFSEGITFPKSKI